MTLYKDKYRVESARLKGWDYTHQGYYFITICTHQRIYYLGQVDQGQMLLSGIGRLAHQFWAEIPAHFPSVTLDEFVIMPNHMHGILALDAGRDVALQRLYVGDNPRMSEMSPKPGSISTIVRSYKSAVADAAHREYPKVGFAWQSRFYDRIVRSDAELHRIQTYIKNNPLKWAEDSLYVVEA